MHNNTRSDQQIDDNVRAHEHIAKDYDQRHPEIFNAIEQQRLYGVLGWALQECHSDGHSALDYGCGTGNLTRHLVSFGCTVTAADVTPLFVEMTKLLHPERVHGMVLNGRDLSTVADASYDIVATYSVLHHIPDYLAAVREMIRVLKPGGILVIDHEASDEHYQPSAALQEFRRQTAIPRTASWYTRRLLSLGWWRTKWRQRSNPRYSEEGDIHVWPDDRIEWPRLRSLFADCGVDVLRDESYLHAQNHYNPELFHTYAEQCSDMHLLVGRKR